MNGYSADLRQVCGCSWAATGTGTEELVSKVKRHAKDAHGLTEVPAELAQKLQNAIRPTL